MQAERTLYYTPSVTLLEPDGGMRALLSSKGLAPEQVARTGNRKQCRLHPRAPRDRLD